MNGKGHLYGISIAKSASTRFQPLSTNGVADAAAATAVALPREKWIGSNIYNYAVDVPA